MRKLIVALVWLAAGALWGGLRLLGLHLMNGAKFLLLVLAAVVSIIWALLTMRRREHSDAVDFERRKRAYEESYHA